MTCSRSIIVLAIALLSTPVSAETSEGYGQGGKLAPYQDMIARANASGELFRIQGKCRSACTMFLSIRNVCVERDAKLYFHAGTTPNVTAQMASTYSSSLRSYVESNHFMDTRELHKIAGDVIISRFGYKACPPRA